MEAGYGDKGGSVNDDDVFASMRDGDDDVLSFFCC